MIFSGKRFEICQPNATIEALLRAMIREQGGALLETGSGEPGDLLLFDLEAYQDAEMALRIERYLSFARPVLVMGLRPDRAVLEQYEAWLERPFSMGAVLAQCAELLELQGPELSVASEVEHEDVLDEEEIEGLMLPMGEDTREVEFDEASILEEEFGLEPGVLGGKAENGEDVSVDVTSMLDLSDLEEAHDLAVDVRQSQSYDPVLHSGRVFSPMEARALDLEGWDSSLMQAIEIPPVLNAPRAALSTQPDMPAITSRRAPRQEEPQTLLDAEELPNTSPQRRATMAAREQEGEGAAAAAAAVMVAVDDETALELRSFSRMLAESLAKITLSARVEDRFEHVHRALHALFARGLDGAAEELQRIPRMQGFSGSLSAFSLVGLFHTVRDRGLRGKLEVATSEQSYILYLEGSALIEIDALVGDHEQLLLQILREHRALDERTYQMLLASRSEPEQMNAPVEMTLRMEGVVSEGALQHAIVLRAKEIFRRACQVRGGTFSFVEIVKGDAHAWPVRDLGLDTGELLLELLRQDAVETGVSEATARARLVPDSGRVMRMRGEALTPVEREVLELFAGGESLSVARHKLAHLGRELDNVINRLKRAHLLVRVEGAPQMLRASAREGQSSPQEGVTAAGQEEGKTRPSGMLPGIIKGRVESTVVAEIDARALDARSTREEAAFERDAAGSGAPTATFPLIGIEEEEAGEQEVPTRSVKGHHMGPSELEEDLGLGEEEGSELDRLLEELVAEDGEERE